jgi:hypothetical protein
MTKNIAKDLKVYIKRANDWKKIIHGTRFNKEDNITVKFVAPLLQMLGWNTLYDGVEFQHHVLGKTKKGKHVDVALYKQNSTIPIILIEVKPMQHLKLGKADSQLFHSYLKNSKTTYGITTNGIELKLFSKRFVTKSSGKARELFCLKLNDFLVYNDVLNVLSKECVESGILDRLSKAMQSKAYDDWRKKMKTGDQERDYKLPLQYIRIFLHKHKL